MEVSDFVSGIQVVARAGMFAFLFSFQIVSIIFLFSTSYGTELKNFLLMEIWSVIISSDITSLGTNFLFVTRVGWRFLFDTMLTALLGKIILKFKSLTLYRMFCKIFSQWQFFTCGLYKYKISKSLIIYYKQKKTILFLSLYY